MDEGSSEAAVRRYWDEVRSRGNFERAAIFYADPFLLNGRARTPADWAENSARFRAHFSDLNVTVDLLAKCEDLVVSRVTYRGMHIADLAEVPARGNKIEVTGIDVCRFADGRIIEALARG